MQLSCKETAEKQTNKLKLLLGKQGLGWVKPRAEGKHENKIMNFYWHRDGEVTVIGFRKKA